ncbi:MAG: hypothetical protein Greene101449_1058 [Candidatus Peregrinibacteria bacterium Greene1014_49]|nr:MAG: hypothetical protein Greene101449_1058 [Candidatus Peregrinibacteria bacterium Greene1014_49]
MHKHSSIRREAKNVANDTYISQEGWKTIVDFTDGGKTAGVSVEDVIKMIKRMKQVKKNR